MSSPRGDGGREPQLDGAAPSAEPAQEAEPPQGPPPPIPPSELPDEDLARLVDDGDIEAVERALREQLVRVPAVLRELDRVLDAGLGNLGAALATMLISEIHLQEANLLAERVLAHAATAGIDELVDLAAALMKQERLTMATRVLGAALDKDDKHGRGLYLSARILARRGHLEPAFQRIARVSPKLLGPEGMLIQARYAILSGRPKSAIDGALKHARKSDDPDLEAQLEELVAMRKRIELSGIDLSKPVDLRTAFVAEYGSLLVELATATADGGRFDTRAMGAGEARATLERALEAIRHLGLPVQELLFANEGGEVVAEGFARLSGAPVRQWSAERGAVEGSWLCMGSSATHPHLPNATVATLQRALDDGVLRTFALVLPSGWRGPLVPDVIGRISDDDDLPWTDDEEVSDILDRVFDEEAAGDHVRQDKDSLFRLIERFGGFLRAAQPLPRRRHVPYLDETPVPRASS